MSPERFWLIPADPLSWTEYLPEVSGIERTTYPSPERFWLIPADPIYVID